jgi:uncharacterized repeat protein (TIGR03847 family)
MDLRRDFGFVSHISPEAIGQPGQRRFRLRIISADGEAVAFWLEKEQLAAIGDAIESVLTNEGYRHEPVPLDDIESPPPFPEDPDADLQVGQLSMGVNRDTRHIVLMGTEAGGGDATAFSFEVDYRRGFELRQAIADVVAAGRPPCPLCGGPIDPTGHICPRSNGHHPH